MSEAASSNVNGYAAPFERDNGMPPSRGHVQHRPRGQVEAGALRGGLTHAVQLLTPVARSIEHSGAAVCGEGTGLVVPFFLAVQLYRDVVVVVLMPVRHIPANIREVNSDLHVIREVTTAGDEGGAELEGSLAEAVGHIEGLARRIQITLHRTQLFCRVGRVVVSPALREYGAHLALMEAAAELPKSGGSQRGAEGLHSPVASHELLRRQGADEFGELHRLSYPVRTAYHHQ